MALALDGEGWVTPEVSLLRDVEYGIRYLVWMQSTDGAKGRNRPERLLLTEGERRRAHPERYRYDAMPIAEMAKWLGWDKKEAG